MTLQAIGRDADKPYGQTLQAHFEYWYEGDKVATIATGWQAPDTAFLLPLTKASDGLFAWRVTFYDAVQWSGWSAWCQAQVDATAPAGAVNVSSPEFPERTPGQTTQSGQVGTPGTFTLTAANAAAEGADGFVWGLNVDEPTTTKLFEGTSGTASVVVTPTRFGTDWMRVRSIDAAGNRGPTRDYFFMASGRPHASHWELDEPAGTTTALSSGGGVDGTIVGTPPRIDGARAGDDATDGALDLNGLSQRVTSTAETFSTDGNFSLVARVSRRRAPGQWLRCPVRRALDPVSGWASTALRAPTCVRCRRRTGRLRMRSGPSTRLRWRQPDGPIWRASSTARP